jgi:hypothetical protein
LAYYAAKLGPWLYDFRDFYWGFEGQLELRDPKHATEVDPLVVSLKEVNRGLSRVSHGLTLLLEVSFFSNVGRYHSYS